MIAISLNNKISSIRDTSFTLNDSAHIDAAFTVETDTTDSENAIGIILPKEYGKRFSVLVGNKSVYATYNDAFDCYIINTAITAGIVRISTNIQQLKG